MTLQGVHQAAQKSIMIGRFEGTARALASSMVDYQWTSGSAPATAAASTRHPTPANSRMRISERKANAQLCLERIAGRVVRIKLALSVAQLSESGHRRRVRSERERRARELYVGEVEGVEQLGAKRDSAAFVRQGEALLQAQADILEALIAKRVAQQHRAVHDRPIRIRAVAIDVRAHYAGKRPARREAHRRADLEPMREGIVTVHQELVRFVDIRVVVLAPDVIDIGVTHRSEAALDIVVAV